MFFLILGSCSVQVDESEINTITEVGDVFGEMGTINNSPRSATIKAGKLVLASRWKAILWNGSVV